MNEMSEREIVSFRGTRNGILMSILEDEPFAVAMESLRYKIISNMNFFTGSPVSLDLGWRELDREDLEELLAFFAENELVLLGIISTSLNTRRLCEDRGMKVIIGRLGLADHHGNPSRKNAEEKKAKTAAPPAEKTRERPRKAAPIEPITCDAAPGLEESSAYPTREMAIPEETLMVKKMVRSGQTVEHPGNLVIIGDVNPGGEVKAGGDLVIVGALRGVAQAGLRGNGETSSIVALKFQPTQLKIREVLETKFDGKFTRSKQPVIASLVKGKIELKIYQ